MGIDVYAGFKTGEKRYSWRPTDDEWWLEFVNTATGDLITPEDLALYTELKDRYDRELDQDKQYALWKLLHNTPLWRMDGALGRYYRLAERAGVDNFIDVEDGGTDDKDIIRAIFNVAGLNVEAAALVDKIYWG